MDFAVLLKAVPDLDSLRFDALGKTVLREGSELFANPFDQRALRVALDLRRPGEQVSVISMGPSAASAPLREALALGADRALLVTDPWLAGSDTLVTARVLARALTRIGHPVVIAGHHSTDAETAQVPAELAALLDVPVMTGVQEIRRDDADRFEILRDTHEGWERFRVTVPAVLSVGEKVAKIRHPEDTALAATPASRVERITATELGFSASEVGAAGSPTVVEGLVHPAPHRTPVRCDTGSMPERVARAAELLRALLEGPETEALPVAVRTRPLRADEEVAVLVTGDDGRLDPGALPLLREVRNATPSLWTSALWIGQPPTPAECQALAGTGARKLRAVRGSDAIDAGEAAFAVGELLASRTEVAGALFVADAFGREVAGQVASRHGWGLTGDATGLRVADDGSLRWEKPAFGGNVLAEVRARRRPSLATMGSGVGGAGVVPDPIPLIPEWFPVPPRRRGPERLAMGLRADDGLGDLDQAHVVVAVGMGIGGPAGIDRLRPSLAAWSAALGATRRVVDAGWVSRHRQVGLTGRFLAPDLAVLLGTSGRPNHFVGWRRARAVLAVNSDPSAPVFDRADVGIVSAWEEALGPLTEALAPLAHRRPRSPGSRESAPPH